MAETTQTTRPSLRASQATRPPVDVFENEHAIVLYADMPGVTPQDLHVVVEDKVLRVEAEVKLTTPAEMKAIYAEFRDPRYVREFTLSNELNAQEIAATLRNGVLQLTIPKQEHAKPRRIEVQVR